MKTLEQHQAEAREILNDTVHIHRNLDTLIARIVRETREGVLEEVMKGIPEEDKGIHPETGMPEYLPYNKGMTAGRNDCRRVILTHITSLKESA